MQELPGPKMASMWTRSLQQLRAQIAWVKVVNREIRPRVTVTVDQLELAVQETSLSQGQPEFLLSEIVLPVDGPEQEDTVANDATGVSSRRSARAPASTPWRDRSRQRRAVKTAVI